MPKNPGYILSYIDKFEHKQYGIAYYNEQTGDFKNYDRVFIRLLNEDLKPKLNEKGKQLITVKHASEITTIGFVD